MMDLTVFKEPLGIMRIFQIVFSFLAFTTTTSYSNTLTFTCKNGNNSVISTYKIEYPFDIAIDKENLCGNGRFINNAEFSFEAQFFFVTGILAIIYAVGIGVVYVFFEDLYKNDKRLPLVDFGISVILAVFWLSGSASWANGVSGLKSVVHSIQKETILTCCTITVQGFTRLTISLILGFLNFFLWASDLWFVYKETAWFQNLQNQPSGV